MDNYINTVLSFLEKAGEIAINSQDKLDISTKKDNSVVTNTDIEISKLFREYIKSLPNSDCCVLDEENLIDKEKIFNNNNEYIWVIDPIDGTNTYATGFPTWAIAVSLYKNFEPLLGFIYMPTTRELIYTDNVNVFLLKNVFTNEQKILEIKKTKFELNRKSIIMAHRLKNFDVDKYTILDFYSAYVSSFYTIVNKSVATFVNNSASLWDIASTLPFLNPCNLICKNIENDNNIFSIKDVEFDNNWKLKNTYLICRNENYYDIKSIIK